MISRMPLSPQHEAVVDIALERRSPHRLDLVGRTDPRSAVLMGLQPIGGSIAQGAARAEHPVHDPVVAREDHRNIYRRGDIRYHHEGVHAARRRVTAHLVARRDDHVDARLDGLDGVPGRADLVLVDHASPCSSTESPVGKPADVVSTVSCAARALSAGRAASTASR